MATDFFDRQDHARKRTGWLVFYFVVAVVLIILAVYAAATAILMGGHKAGDSGPIPSLFDPARLAIVAVATGGLIGLGSGYKILALREGGGAVARMLGGRLLDANSRDPAETKLLNVVEEMAIASGTPVPEVYLLDEEPGINAFAAGFAPGDAAIGVTRGSLDHLNRDQLQGVIAHEFSHILNGDMRLDLKLMGILHGILLLAIIGEMLMRSAGRSGRRSSSDDKKDNGAAAFLLMGVALYAIGFLGVFFGRLIKCAVSRQREYLADASAVQFTRNPEGLANALKKIGGLAEGSRLRAPEAEEAAHMFFSLGVPSMSSLLSTHPPLADRILLLDPQFDGTFPEVPEHEEVNELPSRPKPPRDDKGIGGLGSILPGVPIPGNLGGAILLPAASTVGTVGEPKPEHVDYASEFLDGLPEPIARAVREPFGASAVVYALLLDPGQEIREAQFRGLAEHAAPGLAEEAWNLAPILEALGPASRVPLVDLALPTLRGLSEAQYRGFRANIDPLIRADHHVSLFEFALQRMLLRHLDRKFHREPPPRVRHESLGTLAGPTSALLSALAWVGAEGGEAVEPAFEAGLEALGPAGADVTLRSRERATLKSVGEALDDLVSAASPAKRTLLAACAAIIGADGRVTVAEGEMLRAIADALDCPMPPLLPAGVPTGWPEPGRR